MLARDGVILLERQLLGLGARVLLCDIEIAGVGGREQLDLERGGLGHGEASFTRRRVGRAKKAPRGIARPLLAGKIVTSRAKSSRAAASVAIRPAVQAFLKANFSSS